MNTLEYNCLRQKAGQLCVGAVGHVATFLLVAVLVVAWVLTGPLFQMASNWSESWKQKKTMIAKENL